MHSDDMTNLLEIIMAVRHSKQSTITISIHSFIEWLKALVLLIPWKFYTVSIIALTILLLVYEAHLQLPDFFYLNYL